MQAKSIVPTSPEVRDAARRQDLLGQAAFWGEEYEKNPDDREAAFEFTRVLRRIGNPLRAAEVAQQTLALYPNDQPLSYELGLALTQQGREAEAIARQQRHRAKRPAVTGSERDHG